MCDASNTLRSATLASRSEKLFVLFVLLLSAGAFTNLQVTGPIKSQNTGMLGMQILWVCIYILTLVLFSRKCSQPLTTFFSEGPLIAVVAFALSSVFWSQDPEFTLRRGLALALTLLFGIYFGSRFSLKEQLRLLLCTCAVCIVFSFLFELLGLNPSEGIPGWYGIFFQKNELGRTMVLSSIVFLFWRRVEPNLKSAAAVGFVASISLILLSQSMTSVVILLLMLILYPYLHWVLRKTARSALTAVGLLLAVGAISVLYVAAHLEEVTDFLGRSVTLSGRFQLWIVSAVMALRRPWLGYGYDAFWLPDQPVTIRIWQFLHWMPPHAHNGFLELWLDVGLIGTGISLLALGYYILKSLQFLRRNPEPAAAWPLTFLVFLSFANLTETVFLVRNSIFFILYAAAAASMHEEREKAHVANKPVLPKHSYA